MTKHNAFETNIKRSLHQSESTLDQDTQQRLKAIRQRALQQAPRPALVNWFGDAVLWLKQPAGNVVMASVLAIALLLPQLGKQSQPYSDQDLHQTALLELIEAADAEPLDETADPDFYLWLAEVEGQNA